ncbi:MAG TPA: metallophosphoesterase family protein [Burkholderiaceae bacterium]|nr:metallophosphoesterase family protein [Burkholderiaceae bacterium]
MTIAILTDLHANREAVEACLEHAEKRGADRYVFLGDLVGYGADPEWVVQTVRRHVEQGALVVQGNHDAAVAGSLREKLNPDARRVVDWTRGQLTAESVAFLGDMPMRHEEGPWLFVHANGWAPQDFEYISGLLDAGRSMRATRARITFCGHVHDQVLYHMGIQQRVEQFAPVAGSPVPLSASRRWLAVAGSVGQPRDGNPAACYVTFDELNNLLTFWRVPYDHDGAAAKIRAAGLPESLARMLEGTIR